MLTETPSNLLAHPASHQFRRFEMLVGTDALQRLQHAKVAIFGVGGVGGYVAEALARCGVGELALIDADKVDITNLNRQIIALHSTVGKLKVEVAAARIQDINPNCRVTTYPLFYLPDTAAQIDLTRFDYVADCIDTVAAKVELARRCHEHSVPLIASMGAANKMNPMGFRVADLAKTKMDPLAKAMRHRLKTFGIRHLKVVYSEEQPIKPATSLLPTTNARPMPASNAFVPPAAGLLLASEIVTTLIAGERP